MSEEKQNIPPAEDKTEFTPSFKWKMAYTIGANSPFIIESSKTQKRVLNDLLPTKKNPYSLADWWAQNRESDSVLFLLCGFLHPAEQEMLRHYIDRWSDKTVAEKKKAIEEDDDIPVGTSYAIAIPRSSVQNFLQDNGEFMMDNHENLLLRLSAVKPMVEALDNALYFEGIRRDRKQWVSAMDELLCQNLYEDKASFPPTEESAWKWMNKMCAPTRLGLWQMDLSTTQNILGRLNVLRIYKQFAALWDYADKPVVTQRVNGQLQKEILPWIGAKIITTIGVLMNRGFLQPPVFSYVAKMTPEQREAEELVYKRMAVSAFLTDLTKSTPDKEIQAKLIGAFRRYFQPILHKIGQPVFDEALGEHKNSKGKQRYDRIVKIDFYDTEDERQKAMAAKRARQNEKSKHTSPIKQSPPVRPDSEASR